MWGTRENSSVCESGSKLSPDTESSATLILNFSASRTVRNVCKLTLTMVVCCYSSRSALRQHLNMNIFWLEMRKDAGVVMFVYGKKNNLLCIGEVCWNSAGQLLVFQKAWKLWARWAGFVGRTELVFVMSSFLRGWLFSDMSRAEGVSIAFDVIINVKVESRPGRMIPIFTIKLAFWETVAWLKFRQIVGRMGVLPTSSFCCLPLHSLLKNEWMNECMFTLLFPLS